MIRILHAADLHLDSPFESLPEDWVCPLCGVGKDQFSKE